MNSFLHSLKNPAHRARCRATFTALAAAAVLAACGGGSDDAEPAVPTAANQLYTQTNLSANTVVHLARNADGTLTLRNSVATGGAGTNTGADPLVSQNSLIVTPDHRTLFTVNAASNSVSAFAIDPATGDLSLLAHNATTGTFPVSLAYKEGLLYVLFQGSQTVQAYAVKNGVLGTSLGSYNIIGAGPKPTQITLSPQGDYLTVSAGTVSNELVAFPVGTDGRLGTALASTADVQSPFAGVFVNATTFLSTSAGIHALQALRFSAGGFTAINTPLVGDAAGVPCWLVVTPDGRYAYTGNGGSGSISAYRIASDGSLTLLNAQAANEGIAVAGDSWISTDGKFLYTAYLAAGQVLAYAIQADGSLTKVGAPAVVTTGNTMQGLAGI